MNRSWKTESGETREEVTFVDVEAYARQAEVISQYMRKGRPLLVEGRLKLDQWEDKTTHQKVSKLKVVLEAFSFIDSAAKGGDAGGDQPTRTRPPSAPSAAPAPAGPAPAPTTPSDGAPEEDDVPF